jgi:MoaA/NifB/PqqE/SkfB family radical SAM enzyme
MMLPGLDDTFDLWKPDPFLDQALRKETATIPLIRPPEILHLQVTERCNFACPKCYLPELNATSPRHELPPKTFEKKVLIPAAEVGVKKIVVTGGEPFLYRGLFELLGCAKLHFAEVFLSTSGFFLDEVNTQRVLDIGVDFIQVSLDAVSVECLRKLMGGGAVERLWPNVERFVARRNRRGSATRVIVATVIDRQNIHEIPAVLDRCQAIGVDSVTLQACHDYDTVYRSQSVEWPVYTEYDDDYLRRLADLIDQVIAAKRNGSQLFPHAEVYFRDLYTFFADRASLRIRCQADDFLFVDSRGFIRGCIFSGPLGHVDNGIRAYLTSPAHNRFLDFKLDCHLCTHGCAYRPPMD